MADRPGPCRSHRETAPSSIFALSFRCEVSRHCRGFGLAKAIPRSVVDLSTKSTLTSPRCVAIISSSTASVRFSLFLSLALSLSLSVCVCVSLCRPTRPGKPISRSCSVCVSYLQTRDHITQMITNDLNDPYSHHFPHLTTFYAHVSASVVST